MILEGEASGALTPGQDHPRRDLGQHRHRLRDDRRRARLQGDAVPAGERQPRAEADPARARRRAGPHQSARRHRRRDPRGAAAATPRIPIATSTRTSTTTTATGARTTTRPAPEIIEQTERPPDAFRRRSRHERHVRRHRPPRCGKFNPGIKLISFQPRRAVPRPRRAEAHGVGDRARRSTIRRSPTRICASTPNDAYRMVRRLAREEGLLAGISSGAALAAMLRRRATARARRRSSRCFPTAPRNI